MKRKLILITAISILGMIFAGCGGNNEIRFGTGNEGGTYYAFGKVLAESMQQDNGQYDISVKNSAGSAANLRLISQGFLQLAVVQSDTLTQAMEGTGIFEGTDYSSGYGALTALYPEVCQVIVPADSDIQKISDLVGKCVSVGESESGVLNNSTQILLAHGINFEMIDPVYLSFTDSAEAMKNGEIDAFFCTAGAPTNAVTDLAENMNIRLISIEDDICETMINLYGTYTKCTIPAGTYSGQEEDISTVGVKAVLIAGNNMSRETAEYITRFVEENREELCMQANVTYESDPGFAYEGIPCKFHEGAISYYESAGITVGDSASGDNNPVYGQQDN